MGNILAYQSFYLCKRKCNRYAKNHCQTMYMFRQNFSRFAIQKIAIIAMLAK